MWAALTMTSGGAAGTTREEMAKVLNIPDVDDFPDHIACSSTTRSELVVPVWNGAGVLLGVLDLDSNTQAAFTKADEDWIVPLLADVFRDAA